MLGQLLLLQDEARPREVVFLLGGRHRRPGLASGGGGCERSLAGLRGHRRLRSGHRHQHRQLAREGGRLLAPGHDAETRHDKPALHASPHRRRSEDPAAAQRLRLHPRARAERLRPRIEGHDPGVLHRGLFAARRWPPGKGAGVAAGHRRYLRLPGRVRGGPPGNLGPRQEVQVRGSQHLSVLPKAWHRRGPDEEAADELDEEPKYRGDRAVRLLRDEQPHARKGGARLV
mmetsp:Transcript_10665/g.28352  ORF Transcript_10665/g.28352 Transcript_10665/m.28352 type:complete len:230 (-) Transcript_10665:265-954(-)